MIKLRTLLSEVDDSSKMNVGSDVIDSSEYIKLYRGVNPIFGDIERGRMSIGIKNKLVGALGSNYTDNEEVAMRYGKQIIEKNVMVNRLLKLGSYDDVIRLYQQYENQLPRGLAHTIKTTDGAEQFLYIKKAGEMLNRILRSKYDAIKVPLASGDIRYLSSVGLTGGSLYIVLD